MIEKEMVIVVIPCFLAFLPDQPADNVVYPFAPCGNMHNLSDLLPGQPNNCHSGKLCVSRPLNGSTVSLLVSEVCATPVGLNAVSWPFQAQP